MWTLAYRTAILLYATITTCLSVKMDGGKTAAGELSLVCYNPSFFSLPLTSVYWRRNNTNVVKTKLLWWSEPKKLKHNIKVWTNWRKHRILVTGDLDSNIASNWSCSTDRNDGFTEPKIFGKDGTTEAIIYGNLTFEVFPEVPIEGQEVTFSCTTDVETPEWEVMWIRNSEPVLLTGINSTCLGSQNLTTSDNRILELEIQNVSTNQVQHNITFIAHPTVLINSNWSCKSDVALSASNNITIKEIQTTTQDPVSTADPGVQRKGPSVSRDDVSTYIIIGSVSGGVLLAAVIAAAVLIRRRRKMKENADGYADDTSALEPKRKASLVMEENILYVTSDGEITFSTPVNTLERSKPVMVENVLYASHEEDINNTQESEN